MAESMVDRRQIRHDVLQDLRDSGQPFTVEDVNALYQARLQPAINASCLMVATVAAAFGQNPNLAINAASHALYNNFAGCDLYAEMEEQRETALQLAIIIKEALAETYDDIRENPQDYAQALALGAAPYGEIAQKIYNDQEIGVIEFTLETGFIFLPGAKIVKAGGKAGLKAASKFSTILAGKIQKMGSAGGHHNTPRIVDKVKAFARDEFGGGKIPGKKGNLNKPKKNTTTEWSVKTGDKVAEHNSYGKFYRDPNTGHWWSKDLGKHGGSSWKVFEETSTGLEWIKNSDNYGNYIPTNKGPVGRFIPWKQLSIKK